MAKKKRTRANGEGSYYFNDKRKCWVGQASLGFKPNGKPLRVTRYGKTKKEVLQKITEARIEHDNDQENESDWNLSDATMSELLRNYIEQQRGLVQIKESTYYRKLAILEFVERNQIAKIPIREVSEKQLISLYQGITDYSNSTITKVVQLVKLAFKEAMRLHIITYNISEYIPTPHSKRVDVKKTGFTVSEQRSFLEIINSGERILYKLQMLTEMFSGCRMGEINALTKEDVDFENGVFHISKTISKNSKGYPVISNSAKTSNGMRQVPMNSYLQELYKEYFRTQFKSNKYDLVFLNTEEGLVDTRYVNQEFKRVLRKYQICSPKRTKELTQHSLRHTFATRCIESGMTPDVLKSILGHSDIGITMNTYCDVFDEYKRTHTDASNEYLKSLGLLPKSVTTNKCNDCNDDCNAEVC